MRSLCISLPHGAGRDAAGRRGAPSWRIAHCHHQRTARASASALALSAGCRIPGCSARLQRTPHSASHPVRFCRGSIAVPEGDTIFRSARALHRALAGQKVIAFESVYAPLVSVHDNTPLIGRTVDRVEARGKWLLIYFSGDLILLTHMLMSGSWHIYRPGESWKRSAHDMRIVIETEKLIAVAFAVPVAEFHTAETLARRDRFKDLGPRLLDAEVDEAEVARRLRSRPEL